jgi:hypothetical protein
MIFSISIAVVPSFPVCRLPFSDYPGMYEPLLQRCLFLFYRDSISHRLICLFLLQDIEFTAAAVSVTFSFLLGFPRSERVQMYGPAVKGISGHEDASAYYAISPLLAMPFTALHPVAMGLMLDRLSFLKGESYRIGFLSLGVIVIISFVPFFLLSFQKIT